MMDPLKNLSLEKKFSLFTAVIIVLTMSIIGAVFISNERRLLIEKCTSEGRIIAESMAISATDAILYGKLGLVDPNEQLANYIEQLMKKAGLPVVYAMVQNEKGKILAHSDARYLGIRQNTPMATHALAAESTILQPNTYKGADVLDIASPLSIGSKKLGVCRIGISLSHVRERIRSLSTNIMIITLCLILDSYFVVSILSRRLTRPLRALVEKMGQLEMDPTGLSHISKESSSNDEIGELTTQFHQMVERLNDALLSLQTANKKLIQTEKLAMLGQLSAGLAHEINNPLDGVLNCVRYIKDHPENREKRQKYLNCIDDGVQRIGQIVRELLNLSGDIPMTKKAVGVNKLLADVTHFLEPTLNKKQIEISVESLADPDVVFADAQLLKQVFLNIIMNAIDAMEEGGELTLRTVFRDVNEELEADMVEVRFIDSGVGISEENLARIFDPFYSAKKTGNSTGLGLAVSLGIIEKHDGRIEVSSTLNKGTEFRILLPLDSGM